jgi:hypothetical protein
MSALGFRVHNAKLATGGARQPRRPVHGAQSVPQSCHQLHHLARGDAPGRDKTGSAEARTLPTQRPSDPASPTGSPLGACDSLQGVAPLTTKFTSRLPQAEQRSRAAQSITVASAP